MHVYYVWWCKIRLDQTLDTTGKRATQSHYQQRAEGGWTEEVWSGGASKSHAGSGVTGRALTPHNLTIRDLTRCPSSSVNIGWEAEGVK